MIYLQTCDLLFSPETFGISANWYCPSVQIQHFVSPIVKSKLKSQLFCPLFDFCCQAHWSFFYSWTTHGLARIWVEFTCRFLGCPIIIFVGFLSLAILASDSSIWLFKPTRLYSFWSKFYPPYLKGMGEPSQAESQVILTQCTSLFQVPTSFQFLLTFGAFYWLKIVVFYIFILSL